MTLPAPLRKLQQSYPVQMLVIPGFLIFGGGTLTALLVASRGNIFNLDAASIKNAIGMGGFAGLTYIAGIWQHGLDSKSFHKDGNVDKAVEAVSKLTQAIPGPSAENLEVVVERKD
jgi:hypothetical protein